MNNVNSQMSRQDVEARVFHLVEYNAWKEAPLSTEEPAEPVEGIPIYWAQQMFKGGQLEMVIPHLDVQELFKFFETIDDSNRWYYMNGLLKHPDFQQQQPIFFGTSIEGPGLSDHELSFFLAQFRASVDTLQNKTDTSYSTTFYASWKSPTWLPSEVKDQHNPSHSPTRLPDKSYIKWHGKELPRIR